MTPLRAVKSGHPWRGCCMPSRAIPTHFHGYMAQPEERSGQDYQGISRLTSIVVVMLLLTHMVLAWVVRSQAITTGNDDALYLLLARSLRSFHYLDSHLPGAPLHAQYPPGYPAFLVPFGGNFTAAVAAGILVSGVGLLLAFDLTRRLIGATPALVVLAVICLNPSLIEYAGSLRSESLFMTASIAAIWCASRQPMKPGWLVAAGGLAVYAVLVRSAGLALAVGLLVVWVLERRYRAALIYTITGGFFIGGWLLLTALAPGKFSGRSYAAALQKAETAPSMIGALTNRLEASFAYVYKNIPSALSVPSLEQTRVDNAIWAVILTLGLGAGLYLVWRKYPIIVVFLIGYALTLVLYPFKMTRFIVPIVPLILLVTAGGLVFIVRRFVGRGTLAVTALLCLPLLAGSLSKDLNMVKTAPLCTSADPLGPTTCSTPAQRSFFAAVAFARKDTPPDAGFVTLKEATFALLADRRVQHPERVIRQDSLRLIDTMRNWGLEYVVLTPLHHSRLGKYLLRQCAELHVLQAFPADTYILKLGRPGDAGGSDACGVLAHYATTYSGERRVPHQ